MQQDWRALALALALTVILCGQGSGVVAASRFRWGDIVSSADTSERLVALTFDDGPREPYTSQILDVLRDQGVKATFFLVGENAQRHPDVVRRIAREGHAIGNHSWSHRSLEAASRVDVASEIERTDTLIRAITGRRTELFRPPYGAIGAALRGPRGVAASHRQLLVLWSVEVADWNTRSPLRVAAATIRDIDPGDIVLLHDGGGRRDHVVTATRWMVGHLARRGYRFVTVPELLER